MSLFHFLLIYDLRARRLIDVRTYDDAEEATAAYGQADTAYRTAFGDVQMAFPASAYQARSSSRMSA